MGFATLILILCALAQLADAACWFLPKLAIAQDPCLDESDNQTYPVVSTWRSRRCKRCTCTERGMECCDMMMGPKGFDGDCQVHYDWETCTYEVVKKSDPSISCPHYAVGK